MRTLTTFLCLLAACGTRYGSPGQEPLPSDGTVMIRITGPDPRTGLAKRESCLVFPSAIQAELWIEGIDEPCLLSLQAQTNGDIATLGECPGIPVGSARTLTLQWFVVSPSQTREIVVAESIGRADISRPESAVVEVVFDSRQPSLTPKTKGFPTETPQELARFNCDGDAATACDGAATGVGNNDTCSNFEELCAGTLFSVQSNTCN